MASPTDLPPDVSKGPLLLGVVLALLVLTLLHVGLRLQTRIFLSRAIGWDDYFALAAMVGPFISTPSLAILSKLT